MRDAAAPPDLNFASDNCGPVHPAVMEALRVENAGHAPSYGADATSARAVAAIRGAFEAPEAEVLFLPTGIAANALSLACLAKPWHRVFCSSVAHVDLDETGALGLASGGAEPAPVPARDGRMSPDALATRIAAEPVERRGAISITQATECGTVHAPEAVAVLAGVARAHGMPVHMDGARLANALATLGCSPAAATWRAGVDVLSLGGTKNGLMGAEAVVFFRPEQAAEARIRRQRMGACLSKQRFLAAQICAWLAGDLWRDMARTANAAAARLGAGLGAGDADALVHPVEANAVFARLSRATLRRLSAAGVAYTLWDLPEPALDRGLETEHLTARFVCDWSTDAARVDALLAVLQDATLPA